MQDTEEGRCTAFASARILRAAAQLIDPQSKGGRWNREAAMACSISGRRVPPSSERAIDLSLYGAVQRAASMLLDPEGKPLIDNTTVMSDAAAAIVAASRLDAGSCPALKARPIEFRRGRESGAKPLSHLSTESPESISRTLETATSLAAENAGGRPAIPAQAVRDVLADTVRRANGSMAALDSAVAAAAVAAKGPGPAAVALQYETSAAIVEGNELHAWLKEEGHLAAQAYVEKAEEEAQLEHDNSGEWQDAIYDAPSVDPVTQAVVAERDQTAAYPGGQLKLYATGTDPSCTIEVQAEEPVNAMLDNASAYVTHAERGRSDERANALEAACRQDWATIDAAKTAALQPAFGDPPDLDRAAAAVSKTITALKVHSDTDPMWSRYVSVGDEAWNTLSDAFDAFDAAGEGHDCREAVRRAQDGLQQIKQADGDIYEAPDAIGQLLESVDEIETHLAERSDTESRVAGATPAAVDRGSEEDPWRGGEPGHRPAPETEPAKATGQLQADAEKMPVFRKGHVNETPPKAPPPADAATRRSNMSRSTQSQAR